MWSNDEYTTLILSVESRVLKRHPTTSTNNNHDFTGNLSDIIDNWSEIAEKLKRTGELNDCLNWGKKDTKTEQFCFCCVCGTCHAKLDVFSLLPFIIIEMTLFIVCLCSSSDILLLLSLQINLQWPIVKINGVN